MLTFYETILLWGAYHGRLMQYIVLQKIDSLHYVFTIIKNSLKYLQAHFFIN